MEEDIKILEEKIKFWKLKPEIMKKETQAIENLLTRYKQLEAENQSYIDHYGEPPLYENTKYISKSKVKEKIEMLEKEYKNELDKNSIKAFILKCKIEALQELLREE